MFAAKKPRTTRPIRAGLALKRRCNGRTKPTILLESLLENPGQSRAFLFVFQFGFERVDIGRQPPLLPEVIPDIFIGRDGESGLDTEHAAVSDVINLCASAFPWW